MTHPDLGSNLGGTDNETVTPNIALLEEIAELRQRIEALTRESNTPLVHTPKAGDRPLFARVRIMLEENDGIAPSGQYFGIHGNWVNPDTLRELEPKVKSEELTRKEAQEIATEKITFEAYLRPSEPADVPVELLSVLNDALVDAPIIDPITSQVLGYKQRLRYPYRILTADRA